MSTRVAVKYGEKLERFQYDPAMTVGELKTVVEEVYQVPVQNQQFSLNDSILTDMQTFGFLNIKPGSTIVLTSQKSLATPPEAKYHVTFHLKLDIVGSFTPIIYGSKIGTTINEGLPLKQAHGRYSYYIELDLPEITDHDWYSYGYKGKSYVKELIPRRFFPQLSDGLELFDTFNFPNPMNDVVLRFKLPFRASFGQEIYVCGEITELGRWDPKQSIPLHYESDDIWVGEVHLPFSEYTRIIEYKYIVFSTQRTFDWEIGQNHSFQISPCLSPAIFEISDAYHWNDRYLEAMSRSAFTDAIMKRKRPSDPVIVAPNFIPETQTVTFIVKCPTVSPKQRLVLVGSIPELGEWSPACGLTMSDAEFPLWRVTAICQIQSFEYKYVIIDDSNGSLYWESRENHFWKSIPISGIDKSYPSSVVIDDWWVNPHTEQFKGLGLYTPLFSLRTDTSCGIGQYTDIKKLVDLSIKCGSSLIQLLPIFDTTNDCSWGDAYPYRQSSCFALHPVYLDLLDLDVEIDQQTAEEIKQWTNQIDVDYPAIFAFKMQKLRQIYSKIGIVNNVDYQIFINQNREWLYPYAVFAVLRDQNRTADFRKWPKFSQVTQREINRLVDELETGFYLWIQYVCEKQMKSAKEYAANHGVALKEDLAIGVGMNSVECWIWPELFHDDMECGAPPDAFAKDGQNWHFPTYNWDEMRLKKYSWWSLRMQRMANLFHVLRIDHILGFFRIWEIPKDTGLSLLGHFSPANTIDISGLKKFGDLDRMTKPYVTEELLKAEFGNNHWKQIRDQFFNSKLEFKTSDIKKMRNWLVEAHLEEFDAGLVRLFTNVLLIEDTRKPRTFHVRANVKETSSFREFPMRQTMSDLHDDFMYNRQTWLWMKEARAKLDVLVNSTKMLICGEDLGMMTEGMMEPAEYRGILSLCVQRMPKKFGQKFQPMNETPYFSVCCPSTHDMSSLRGWWHEKETSDFWTYEMEKEDRKEIELSPPNQEEIVKMNLMAKSMWTIFLLQDVTGIVDRLRVQSPDEEQINVPSNESQKWNYRHGWKIEDLIGNEQFCSKVRELSSESGRCKHN